MNIFRRRQQPVRGDHLEPQLRPSPGSVVQQEPNDGVDAFLTDVVGLTNEQIELLHAPAGQAALHAVLLRGGASIDPAALAHELRQPGGGVIGIPPAPCCGPGDETHIVVPR